MKQQNLKDSGSFFLSATNQTTNVARRLHGVAKETQKALLHTLSARQPEPLRQ